MNWYKVATRLAAPPAMVKYVSDHIKSIATHGALPSGTTNFFCPIDWTGWKYNTPEFKTKIQDKVKKRMLADGFSQEEADYSAKGFTEAPVEIVLINGEDKDYPGWRAGIADFRPADWKLIISASGRLSTYMDEVIKHEMMHYAQHMMSLAASGWYREQGESAGTPGKKHNTPQFKQPHDPRDLGANMKNYLMDDIEFYPYVGYALYQAIQAWGRPRRHGAPTLKELFYETVKANSWFSTLKNRPFPRTMI